MRKKAGAIGIVALVAALPALRSSARAQSTDEPVEAPPPMSDVPQPVPPPAGFHEHDGLYIRLAAGAAALHASWMVGPNHWSVTGTGFAVAMALGGSVLPNLVLYAEITRSAASDPTRKVDDLSTKLTNYDVGLAGIGPGAAYYLVPENIYFSGTIAFSRLQSRYNGPSGSEGSGSDLPIFTDMGIGGTLMVGKEWWLSANWGLGVAGIFHLASMKITNDDSRVTAEALSLVLSATYN
jgi:hypothetical protein